MKKLISRTFLSFCTLFLAVLTSVSAQGTNTTLENDFSDQFTKVCEYEKLGDVSYKKGNDGEQYKVIKITDTEGFAKLQGIELDSKDEITVVIPEEDNKLESPKINADNGAYLVGDLYLDDVNTTRACAMEMAGNSFYGPPGGKMSFTDSWAVTLKSSYKIDAKLVKAELDITVGKTESKTDEQNISVPYGKRGEIQAYRMDKIHNFKIMQKGIFSDSEKGSGYVSEPLGFCFVTRIY
ncbi:hypothetical protein C2W64_00478 [Brevibacillus laterosporus]|nr:hypothetical protein [Brevibacillus laterosporus]RAP17467.1 hypothetical protein C2W64_00478 [Brevibacillus laterosporus]